MVQMVRAAPVPATPVLAARAALTTTPQVVAALPSAVKVSPSVATVLLVAVTATAIVPAAEMREAVAQVALHPRPPQALFPAAVSVTATSAPVRGRPLLTA